MTLNGPPSFWSSLEGNVIPFPVHIKTNPVLLSSLFNPPSILNVFLSLHFVFPEELLFVNTADEAESYQQCL